MDQIASRDRDIDSFSKRVQEVKEELDKVTESRNLIESKCKVMEEDMSKHHIVLSALREQLLESNSKVEVEHTKTVHLEQTITRLEQQYKDVEEKYKENVKVVQELHQ